MKGGGGGGVFIWTQVGEHLAARTCKCLVCGAEMRLEYRLRLNHTEEPGKCLCIQVQLRHKVPSGWG